ncbi:MAG: hypothetical protein OEY01_06460 [Desulfobulbaceae bacterium]|nr:hypothetical protein [Desulfobulbaceae bacterium]HIJ78751.1 hypothetical protein [Deltaproteobacteria bacterium]
MFFKIAVICAASCLFSVQAIAMTNDYGRKLFTSTTLGGGTTGKTCLTCHEKGRDFSKETLTKQHFTVMGNEIAGLPAVINFCIEVALRGQELAPDGEQMRNLIAYLKIFIEQNNKEENP